MILDIKLQFFQNAANGSNFVKDILPYISTGMVVVIFLFDRIKGHQVRLNEKKRTWYFKAFFENSVKKIDDFIAECDKIVDFIAECDKIVETEINNKLGIITTDVDVSSDNRSSQEKLSDCKRRFSLNVIQVLQLSYNNLFENLEEIVRNVEDEGILAMENVSNKDQYWKFSETLNRSKALILAKMSEPALGKIKSKTMS